MTEYGRHFLAEGQDSDLPCSEEPAHPTLMKQRQEDC